VSGGPVGRTVVSQDGRFEWDEEKDAVNIKKHGFSFEEILDVFDDPDFFEDYDWEHSGREDRYFGIGCLNGVLFVTSFYTERSGRIRVFSARKSTNLEKEVYDDKINQTY
jgi:uncharacterized DUF497 family protein